jgi:hypothetical protein
MMQDKQAEYGPGVPRRSGLSPETRRRLLRAGAATVAATLYVTPHMRTTRLAAATACLSPTGAVFDATIDGARCDLIQGRIILRNTSAQSIIVQELKAGLSLGGAAPVAPAYSADLPAGATIVLRAGVTIPPGQTAATVYSLNPAGRTGTGRTTVTLNATLAYSYNTGPARLECSTAAAGSFECAGESGGNGGGNGGGSNANNNANTGGGENPQGSKQPPPPSVPPPILPSGGGETPSVLNPPPPSPPGPAGQGGSSPHITVLSPGQPELVPPLDTLVSSEGHAPAPESAAVQPVQPATPVPVPAPAPAPAQVPPLVVPVPATTVPPIAPQPAPPGTPAAQPGQAAAQPTGQGAQPSTTLPRAGGGSSSPVGGLPIPGLGFLVLALGRLLRRLARLSGTAANPITDR